MITEVKYINVLTQEGNTRNQIRTILKKNAFADAGVSVRRERVHTNHMSQAPQVVSTLSVIKRRMGIMKIRTQR
ncbi:unnamed protein product [Arctia plantaginis]|uniref:Uncharacterized protein n=1 Tax=Arctia plantaginis TaxID=874455 RepID=A0A8S1BHT6_ARCPL|nr:unnamed protein product [Arctia plantaginis]